MKQTISILLIKEKLFFPSAICHILISPEHEPDANKSEYGTAAKDVIHWHEGVLESKDFRLEK